MFLLQVSIFGDRWGTVAKAEIRQDIEKARENALIFPMTITRIVKKCLECKTEVELGQLDEFNNRSICPNCTRPWGE